MKSEKNTFWKTGKEKLVIARTYCTERRKISN